jgi:hypothetical protein
MTRRRWTMLAMVALVCACEADRVRPSGSRILDSSCRDRPCATTGSARRITGPTEDTTAYRMGPGKGTVTVPLFLPAGQVMNHIEVLIEGHGQASTRLVPRGEDGGVSGAGGSSSAGSPTTGVILIPEEYDWVSVGTVQGTTLQFDLTIEVDAGSHLDFADVRYSTEDIDPGCGST